MKELLTKCLKILIKQAHLINYLRAINKMGLTGFDSIDLCKCKHVVRWIIST